MATTKRYGRNGGEYAGGYYRRQPGGWWYLWANVEDYANGKPRDTVLCGPLPVAEVRAQLARYVADRAVEALQAGRVVGYVLGANRLGV
jgi:hypothetical protein